MACDNAVYVIRVIEHLHDVQMWFFWRSDIADWVSDLERATRYLYSHGAAGLAERLSREHGVEAAAVREVDVC